MAQKLPLSVAIITFNEELKIGATLKSISDIASEIIIIDSHSTDETVYISSNYTDKIFIEDWKGHVTQKNSALSKCTQKWILCLDADEVVTEKLKESIIKKITNPNYDGYLINRKTFYLDKLMNHAWQPDWNLRLVKSTSDPKWEGLDPHDFLTIKGKTSKIIGNLIHYSYNGISHHFYKTIDYAKISAKSYLDAGKKFRVINLIINPLFAFFRLFVLRKGIFDGTRGFIAAFSSFFGTFMKYIFLWDLERNIRDKTKNI